MTQTTFISLIIFAVTYIIMFAFQKLRLYAALCAAAVFVVLGSTGIFPDFSYTAAEAVSEIDWNVLMMIAGTMGTVFFFIESKMPNRLAELIVSKVPNVKWMVFVLSLFAGIISAFVDNVATVLMIAPVALAICSRIKISPVPAIICIAVSSNLQGAATLVGDTTSILLAKAVDLDFMGFFFVSGKPGMFWVTEAGALAAALIILIMFRKEKEKVSIDSVTEVKDKLPTVLLILTIITLIAVSFIPYKSAAKPGQFYKPDITNGLICMGYFAVGVLYQLIIKKNGAGIRACFKDMDYYTLALLAGLFVVIGGISRAGVIDLIGQKLSLLGGSGSGGSVFLVYSVIVWASVILSAFIDNIPYTATMLPVVAVLAADLSSKSGVAVDPRLFYFGLLVGATLGGNLTPIGASANIAGIGILRKNGYEVSTGTFMKYGVPFTLAAVTTGWLLLWAIWM